MISPFRFEGHLVVNVGYNKAKTLWRIDMHIANDPALLTFVGAGMEWYQVDADPFDDGEKIGGDKGMAPVFNAIISKVVLEELL